MSKPAAAEAPWFEQTAPTTPLEDRADLLEDGPELADCLLHVRLRGRGQAAYHRDNPGTVLGQPQ